MVQAVKHLPSRCETLSSNFSTAKKKKKKTEMTKERNEQNKME
jgi:hypothetical protein